MNQNIIDRIIKTECMYPEAYASKVDTTYGILFHDEENKSSIHSNHAIILPDRMELKYKHKCSSHYFETNVKEALEHIISFYQNKDTLPTIFSPLYQGFMDQMEPLLMKYHFHIVKMPFSEIILLSHGQTEGINNSHNIVIKRLKTYSDEIVDIMYDETKRCYYKNILKKAMKNPNFHYYIGFIEKKPIVAASIYYDSYRSARLSDIAITNKYHFMDVNLSTKYEQDFIKRLIYYYKKISKLPLYLYVDNPTTKNIYLEAGYRCLNVHLETWLAQYDGLCSNKGL